MGSTFTILSGRRKRSTGPRCLWLLHLPCAGAAAGPAQQEISPSSSWPREAISAWLSVYTVGALAVFFLFACLFVCWGWGFWFFWGLWYYHLKWLLTARLNNFCPPYPLRLSFYNLILLWAVTRVCLDIVSPNVMLTHISCSAVFYPYLSLFTPLLVIFLQNFLCFVWVLFIRSI